MRKKRKDISLSAQVTIAIIALIIIANVILGFFMINQLRNTMKAHISEHMLDLSNTAAATLDGDALGKLTADDEDTPEYKKIIKELTVFQDNINLDYIYCIKDLGNKNFVFSVDPTPVDPGEFGSPITYTDALYAASLGTPSVDKEPYTDKWGTFYSAYSPVYDSNGNISGIVAVDFNSEWYDSQARSGVFTVILSTILSLFIAVLTVLLIMRHVRKKFRQVDSELNELADDIDKLTEDLDGYSGLTIADISEDEDEQTDKDRQNAAADNINLLSKHIRATHKELNRYLNHMNTREKYMIAALASDYRSVFYVNLDTDTGICYRLGSDISYIKNRLSEGEDFVFSELSKQYVEKYVTEKYREEIMELLKPDAIREGLRKETVITRQFLEKSGDRERYEMLRIAGNRRPDRDTINEISIGISDVDKETRETMDRNRALSEALAAANESSKAKTVFLSNMSHEIRTPMNAIIGLDTIALSDPDITGKEREYFTKIGVSAKHLLNIINDILDMSRIESGNMAMEKEEFKFSEVMEQINTIIGEQCSAKELSYSCHIGEDIAEYYIGDQIKLKQVLINILGNAVKFTPEGGSVELSAERLERYEGNTTLRFSIKDTGIGMDKEFIPHIFDAFSQEDSAYTSNLGSTGLGMAITKSLVEMMNGRIEVESEKGKGSTFCVTLTLLDSDRCAKDDDSDTARGHNQDNSGAKDILQSVLDGKNILLAEDMPVNAEIMTTILTMHEMNVDVAENGRIAVEKFSAHEPGYYAAILMDVRMPEMDGLEATAAIRAMDRPDASAIPIIALTANAFDEDVQRSLQGGMNAHLSKPVEPIKLLTVMEKLIQSADQSS